MYENSKCDRLIQKIRLVIKIVWRRIFLTNEIYRSKISSYNFLYEIHLLEKFLSAAKVILHLKFAIPIEIIEVKANSRRDYI